MNTRREVIGVLGSGREEHRAWVEPLARWIAAQGFHLLTGAGGGVMRAAAEAFVAVEGRAGLSLGIVPGTVGEEGWRPKPGYPNEAVEVPILTHLPLSGARGTEPMSRNHLNVLTARALVALPGGAGTVSEAVLALRYGKPLILFGPREAFHAFPAELERTEALERVCAFLLAAPHPGPSGSG
ncbi:MAG TPA: molybdenum cofactor carrier protein [Archangium sp.]|uniref:SLOG cluster 4 domain-containing protein n=1 Tax=Archangium sp. TaxID=1872627 RepID=UPI002ED88659